MTSPRDPKALRQELVHRYYSWRRHAGESWADSESAADMIIASLVAGTASSEVTAHPMVQWISQNFLVDAFKASAAWLAATAPSIVITDPTDIPNLVLWLDGSDISSLYQTDGAQPFGLGSTAVALNGDPVGCWADKSGNANHMNQATALEKPAYTTAVQNGLSAVRANWGPNLFSTSPVLSQVANISVIHVSNITYNDDRGAIFATNSGSVREFKAFHDSDYDALGAGYGLEANDTGVARTTLPSDVGTETHIFEHVKEGLNLQTWLDGVASSVASLVGDGVVGNDYTRIFKDGGGAYPHDGHLMELIVVDGAISAAYRVALRTWLNSKWAVF